MGIYSAEAQMAYDSILEAGGMWQLTKQIDGVTDPVSRRQTGAQRVTRSMPMLQLPPSSRALSLVPQELRAQVQMLFHIAPLGNEDFVAAPTDVITWADGDYRVIWTVPYNPAGDGAIYVQAFGAR